MAALLGILHLLIDIIKDRMVKKKIVKSDNHIKRFYIFVVDQITHIGCMVCCWLTLGRDLQVRECLTEKVSPIPSLPLITVLGVLIVLKPVSIVIDRFIFEKENINTKAGKYIGYMERIIILILMIYGAFSTIAFVLTAKSIARFNEIEKNEIRAKYYLIGTLLSTGSVMVVCFLLGLCNV